MTSLAQQIRIRPAHIPRINKGPIGLQYMRMVSFLLSFFRYLSKHSKLKPSNVSGLFGQFEQDDVYIAAGNATSLSFRWVEESAGTSTFLQLTGISVRY